MTAHEHGSSATPPESSAAQGREWANHVVQFSTGIGSAEVLRRVCGEYGSRNVVALSADTLIEDHDNWRFAREVVRSLQVRWVVLADGRTPMQVGRDERVVPNNRLAVCSRILKRKLLRDYIEAHYSPDDSLIYLGFDWTEPHRIEASKGPWAPYEIAAPLADPPYVEKPALIALWKALGIEPPSLYADGFAHANWQLALLCRSKGERQAVKTDAPLKGVTDSEQCQAAALPWEDDGWKEGLRRDEEPARRGADSDASEGHKNWPAEAEACVRGARQDCEEVRGVARSHGGEAE